MIHPNNSQRFIILIVLLVWIIIYSYPNYAYVTILMDSDQIIFGLLELHYTMSKVKCIIISSYIMWTHNQTTQPYPSFIAIYNPCAKVIQRWALKLLSTKEDHSLNESTIFDVGRCLCVLRERKRSNSSRSPYEEDHTRYQIKTETRWGWL